MSKTRDKSGAEVMGWLEGGYQTLIDALERKIRELGGEIHAGTSVEQIVGGGSGGAEGLAVEGVFRPFDFVLCTLAPADGSQPAGAGAPSDGAARPLPLPRRRLPPAADAAEHQPVLPPEHHRPPGAADDRRRDDARRRSGHGRRPPRLRLEVRRSLLAAPRAAGRRDRARVRRAREDDLPDLRDDDILAVGRPARARHRAGAHRRRREEPARHVLRAGPRACVDRARLPGDRQRPGCDGRSGAGRCRGSSSGSPTRERAAA